MVPPPRSSVISNDNISNRNRRRTTTKQKIGCLYFSSALLTLIFWGACLIIICCTIEQLYVSVSIVHRKIDTTYSLPPPPVTGDSEETLIRRRWNILPSHIRVPRNKTQQCANALLDQSTHRLVPTENKKECPSSIDLSKTKKMIRRGERGREKEPEPLLTFLLIYYNDDQNFAHQLDSWMKFSYEAMSRIRFIVVDDGSDVGHRAVELLGSNLANSTTTSSSSNYNNNISLSSLDIRVYEIDQDIDWNIGGGRNLGFWIASQGDPTDTYSSSWVFMNDADILVPPETMDFVLGLTEELRDDIDVNVDVHDDNDGFELNTTTNKQYHSSGKRNTTTTNNNNKVYGFFQRIGKNGNSKKKYPHPAVMLSTTGSYWTAGGCDEDFVNNYGYTDPHFFYRVEKHHSLNVVNIHERMDLLSIPPLIEMSNKHKIFRSCPESIYCNKPKQKQSVRFKVNNNNENNNDNDDGEKKNKPSLSKDTEINKELYVQKTISGNWSIDYLRFTWRRVW
ncbi:MAG: hypothetical protein ACI8RD_000441 [Bacillariaceae sp.]|jgi:hypothetical protein